MAHEPATAGPLEAVAIIGLAGRFPGAADVDQLWRNLRAGVESIRFFTADELERSGVPRAVFTRPDYVPAKGVLDGVELFDAAFFGFTPREAEGMDPQHRLFLECSWEALENAGYCFAERGGRIGVFAGSAMSTYLLYNLAANPGFAERADGLQIRITNDKDFLTTLVSYKLNLNGPSVGVQTACSTSLVAVHLACQALLDGDCDMALAGGVAVSFPHRAGCLYTEGGIYSPDGHCRAFDAKAQGCVEGNGAGVVVLKRLAEALADGDRVRAVIRGSAVNNDGSLKVGYTAPSVDSQTAVIQESLAMAGIDPRAITLVEAHGSGTPLGDPIEVEALTRAFRKETGDRGFCALGSVKTNLGHLDNAAGIASLIKTVQALEHREIPPSLHFEQPNPTMRLAETPFYVNTELREWRVDGTPRRAGVSSLGIGGTNAHLVLEEAPAARPPGEPRAWQLLLLSAKTPTALDTMAANLAAHLEQYPDLCLADVAHTLRVGRQRFAHRRMLVCRDAADARAALASGERALTAPGGASSGVVFLLPGLGDQYPGMGRELYRGEPSFRATVDRCCAILEPHLGLDLREVLYGGADRGPDGPPAERRRLLRAEPPEDAASLRLHQTLLAQPAVFVVEYALAQLWMEWGICPRAMIGYSLGELVVACLAGVWSLEEALLVVAERARCIEGLPAGTMLAVPLPENEVQPLLGGSVSLCAADGPGLSVVGGPEEGVARLERRLASRGVVTKRLRAAHAFHSPMMQPAASRLASVVAKTRPAPPRIPFVSNLTGTWITPSEAADPAYWASQLCRPVRFGAGLGEILAGPGRILLEVGPGDALCTLARQHPGRTAEHLALPSLRDRRETVSDLSFLLTALGRLWLAGAAVDWDGFAARERPCRVPLPTYPFERRPHWVGPSVKASGRRELDRWFYAPLWRQSPLPRHLPGAAAAEGASHWLVFLDGLEIGSGLAQRLQGEGHRVTTIAAGEAFSRRSDARYAIDPRNPDDYTALLRELRETGPAPQRIAHLWSVDQDGEDLGFYSLLFLARALGGEGGTAPIHCCIVSSRVQDVTGEEPACPRKATLLGLCKVAPQELPHLRCQSIDVQVPEEAAARQRLLDQLVGELTGTSLDRVVAYRGRHRWVRDFGPLRLDAPSGSGIREGGTWLIAGEAEGMGLAIAGYLIRAHKARLALLVPPSFPAGGHHGLEVLVLRVDLANVAQMREAVKRVRRELGEIHGVIQAAGGPGPGTIQSESRAAVGAALASQIEGTFALAAAIRDLPPDHFVLFGSTASIAGGFLDAFAQQQGDRVVSIDWSPAIPEHEAGEAFERVVASGLAQVVVCPQDLSTADSSTADSWETLETPAAAHIRPPLAVAYAPPASSVESTILGIWRDAFGIAGLGVHDGFFDLDGSSLLAIQIATRIRKALRVEIPMTLLFEAPTVAELARRIAEARPAGVSTIPRRRQRNHCPLAPDQERIWFIQQLDITSSAYNIYSASRLRGPIDVAALTRSLEEIVRRHEILRTTFVSRDGRPVQDIAPHGPIQAPLVDLRALPGSRRAAEAESLANACVQRPFLVTELPLFRVLLVLQDEEDYVCTTTFHHIVMDWVSFYSFQRELSALYKAFSAGLPPPLPEPPLQYADFAVWQRQTLSDGVVEAQLDYWRQALADAPPSLDLPTDRPRPALLSGRGARQPAALSKAHSDAVRALAHGERATLFMVLLALFKALLFRWTGQTKVVVGSPIAHRELDELREVLGFFLNHLAFCTDASGEPTFRELLRRVRRVATEAYAHQDVPFGRLVEELRPERDLSRTPLTQVTFLFLNPDQETEVRFPGVQVLPYQVDGRSSKFDITFSLWDDPGSFAGWMEYSSDLFEQSTILRMLESFQALVGAAVADPDRPLAAMDLLSAAQRHQFLVEWNDTAAEPPEAPTLTGLWQAQVARTPDAVALSWDGQLLSYGELDRRSRRLAHRLCGLGVGPEVRVAICAGRSPETVVGLLAVLAAGGAYLPLDPAGPQERLALLLEDSGATVLLTRRLLADRLPPTRACLVFLDEEPEGPWRDAPPAGGAGPEGLAYVLYTSGSTGRPKGVEVPHRGLVNYLAWAVRAYGLGPGWGAPLCSSLSFDLSVTSLWAPLLAGASLELVGEEGDVEALGAALESPGGYGLVKLTPTHLEVLQDVMGGREPGGPIGTVVVGGEALRGERLRFWRELAPATRLINEYGPTETVVGSAFYEIPAGAPAEGAVPIGRGIGNMRLYVLDRGHEPVPVGVVGEVHVGGPGVARGYLGQAARTAERFVPDRFGGAPGERLYRTGDLARWSARGELEYVGRADHQVKVRGFRIEPGEVEAALCTHAAVKEAVALTSGEDGGPRQLAAYVVPVPGAERPAIRELREHLAARLPKPMVPSRFVLLDALPLTAGGKVDRWTLAAGDALARPGRDQTPATPRGPVEEVLAGIWQEVLGLERVGVLDDFFDLGGHSLLASQVLSRLRDAFGVDLPLQRLFEAVTVRELARLVTTAMEAGAPVPPPIRRREKGEEPPLSWAQEPLWQVDQILPGTPLFNVPAALRLLGPLDLAALRCSVEEIVLRHEALRTTFAAVDRRPFQVIHLAASVPLPVIDLGALRADRGDLEALRLALEFERRPFSLAAGPLLRTALLRLREEDHRLLFSIHHIVSDAWSMGVLVRELTILYESFSRGCPSPLPELAIQYADYALWQRRQLQSEAVKARLAYWRERLAGNLPLAEIPTDFPRPADATFSMSHRSFTLHGELSAALADLGRRERVTPFMIHLAAFSTLLYRRTGKEDILIGTLVAGRTRSETEGLIGLFVNTVVLRLDLSGPPAPRQLLRQAREKVLGAFARQDLPFDLVQRDLDRRGPLFNVLLVFQNAPVQPLELPSLTVRPWPDEEDQSQVPEVTLTAFDLVLVLEERPSGVRCLLRYKTGLFRTDTIDGMLRELKEILEGFADEAFV